MLRIENISKQYGNYTALNDVSLHIPKGSIFGLLGPNGAGKTSLIRIINQIVLPDAGQVFFDGEPLQPKHTAQIGYLPEERGLYKSMKVGEQALYLAQLKGLSHAEAKQRLEMWFEKFQIMPWWNKKLEELSKGMQQKIQFIITVLHEPKLLIFDEPFSGFDPLNAELLKHEMLQLRDRGATIIFSTHNMASVEEVCDDIALIHRSQVRLQGSVREIREQHRTGEFSLTTTAGQLSEHPELYSILEQVEHHGLTTYRLKKQETLSNSALVQSLASEVEIRSFSEILPTMNDIFLRTVGDDVAALTGNQTQQA